MEFKKILSGKDGWWIMACAGLIFIGLMIFIFPIMGDGNFQKRTALADSLRKANKSLHLDSLQEASIGKTPRLPPPVNYFEFDSLVKTE